MTYALITRIPLVEDRLPAGARRLDTGEWVMALPDADPALWHACGWWAVVDAARPADTPTTTWDRTLELVDGVPTVVWVERPKTAGEIAAETAAANSATLTGQVGDNVATLLTTVATYSTVIGNGSDPAGTTSLQALGNISNANLMTAQNMKALIGFVLDLARQGKTVARQDIRIARLVAGELDSVDSGS